MVTGDSPINRQAGTWLKTLPSRNFISKRSKETINQSSEILIVACGRCQRKIRFCSCKRAVRKTISNCDICVSQHERIMHCNFVCIFVWFLPICRHFLEFYGYYIAQWIKEVRKDNRFMSSSFQLTDLRFHLSFSVYYGELESSANTDEQIKLMHFGCTCHGLSIT